MSLGPVLGAALDLDHDITEARRIVFIDSANVMAPKLNRYFAVVALLTLGEDKQTTEAARQLNQLEAAAGHCLASWRADRRAGAALPS